MNEARGSRGKQVLAVVGTYRKGGVVDTAVDELLAAAAEAGATTEKIYLIDEPIEFCANCRACTQPRGSERGRCTIDDAVPGILDRIEGADALVFGSPTNFGTATAVTKRLIERMVCYADWPWGKLSPKLRRAKATRKAVVISASQAPSLMNRLFDDTNRVLKRMAELVGARTVGVLAIGLAAGAPRTDIGPRARRKARRLGKRLAGG